MDISIIINDRIKSSGKSQAEIANAISTTPSQLGLFLKGEASLSRKSLNECLEILNIDLMMYKRRNDLAKRAAKVLKAKLITDIGNLTQDDIIALTGEKELRLFHEEDEQRFKEIMNSGYVDPESTFNYMKDLISFYLKAPEVDKITNKQAMNTIAQLMSTTAATSAVAAVASGIIARATPIGAIVSPLLAIASSAGIFGLISRNKFKK